MTRVLVVDDSATVRELLVAVLRADPQIEVIGEATNGREAVELTKRLRPDVVTMDVNMPEMDGLAATKQIMIEAPVPIVIVSGTYDPREVEGSMQALRMGALAVLGKPVGFGSAGFEADCRRLVETVKTMADVKVLHHWPSAPAVARSRPAGAIARRAPLKVIGIAASTGGPAALQQILSRLPATFPVPLLIVQHISRDFSSGLAAWLSTISPLRIKVSEHGEPIQPSTAYIGAEGHHLGVTAGGRIHHAHEPAIGGFCPSATYLFQSIGRAFGSSALGVVLTGMGRDGAEGLGTLKASGGRIIAQGKTSSVVYGMPGAALQTGYVDAVVELDAIAPQLVELTSERRAP